MTRWRHAPTTTITHSHIFLKAALDAQQEEVEEDDYEEDDFDEDDFDEDDEAEDPYDPDDSPIANVKGGGGSGGGERNRTHKIEVGGWNRNKFVSSATTLSSAAIASLAKSISAWRAQSQVFKAIMREPLQELVPDIFAYLLAAHRSEVESRTSIPHGRLTVTFGPGPNVYCLQQKGEIYFGWGILQGRIDDLACSSYAQEKLPMKAICRMKEDVLMWLLLHEFLHLFTGNEAHTPAFFDLVTAEAHKHMFLFSMFYKRPESLFTHSEDAALLLKH